MSFTQRKKPGSITKKKSAKPRVFVPKPYQAKSIEFCLQRAAAGLFLAPGLGKTSIILFAFKILKKLGLVDELLVVAKRRIIYNVWPNEVKKWNLPFKCTVVHGGGPRERAKKLLEKSSIKLINYEGLIWLKTQKQWLRSGKRIMLAVDESSKMKNTNTVRFSALKKMLPKFVRRYILTGSPATTGLINLFGQMYILDFGETFSPYITKFRTDYFQPSGFMGYDWVPQEGADKRIFKKIKPYILRYGTDQLDLPPIKFINRYVELPKKARRLYDEMQKELIVKLENKEIVAANAAVASGKLRQIANGGIFFNRDSAEEANPKKAVRWTTVHDEKCEDLVELLEELNGEPALVAYEYKHDMLRLKKYFADNAPQFKNAPFIGSHTSDKEADKLQAKWDRGELPVMFGQPQSVAHGLNLQGKGGIVIFFAMTWSLEDYEQFFQRVWRQGQERRVLVYRILARHTVDEIMVHVIRKRNRDQRALLTAMEQSYGIR